MSRKGGEVRERGQTNLRVHTRERRRQTRGETIEGQIGEVERDRDTEEGRGDPRSTESQNVSIHKKKGEGQKEGSRTDGERKIHETRMKVKERDIQRTR